VAFCRLQLADIAKQRAKEQKNKLLKQTFWNNHIVPNNITKVMKNLIDKF
jgi:hypothetical protein